MTKVTGEPDVVRRPGTRTEGKTEEKEKSVALSVSDVEKLGRLARIDLSPEELEHLAPQLDVILDAVARVGEIDTEDVPATSHPIPLTNVFRADEVTASLPAEGALAMAPAAEEDRFRVPRILGESQ